AGAQRVCQRDNGLTALLVETIRRDFDTAGHAVNPSAEDFRNCSGFGPHFRPPEGTLNLRSAKDLGQAPRVGFEPTTNRLTAGMNADVNPCQAMPPVKWILGLYTGLHRQARTSRLTAPPCPLWQTLTSPAS